MAAKADVHIRGEILQLLLGLSRDRGMTILVVIHDLGLAWNVADRVAVMYLGRIVEVGTTEQILASPQRVIAPAEVFWARYRPWVACYRAR